MRITHPDDEKAWGVMTLDRDTVSSPHSRSLIGAQPVANNDMQFIGMTTPIDHQWHEINSADGRFGEVQFTRPSGGLAAFGVEY